jgi:hypothetical protein
MSKSLKKVDGLRHAVRYSIVIAVVAGAVCALASTVAGFSPFLLAALLIPLAEFVACYRFDANNRVAPQELKFFLMVLHAVFLTSLFSRMPDGLPRVAATVQYLSLAFLALGIGAFWFKARILEAVGPEPDRA